MAKNVKRIFHGIQRVEAAILAGGILAIAALTIINVIARSVFGASLAAAEELCQFLIVLVTFAGLSYGAGRGRHIRMTALYDQLGDRTRKGAMLLIAGTTALLLFYLAWLALDYVLVVRRLGSVSPVLQVPLYLVYSAAPVGLLLAGAQYVLAFLKNVREEGIYLAWETRDEYLEADGEDDVPIDKTEPSGDAPCSR